MLMHFAELAEYDGQARELFPGDDLRLRIKGSNCRLDPAYSLPSYLNTLDLYSGGLGGLHGLIISHPILLCGLSRRVDS